MEGGYEHRKSRPDYKHVRKVRWEWSGDAKPRDQPMVTKTLTDVTAHPVLVEQLLACTGGDDGDAIVEPGPIVDAAPPYTAELAVHSLLPEPGSHGNFTCADFRRDERRMGLLFESFVRRFLELEQAAFEVRRDWISWSLSSVDPAHDAYLPAMQTDITLTRPGRRVIVETKFYAEPLRVGRWGDRKLRERDLYQLFAYLENLAHGPRPADAGVILYAGGVDRFDVRFEHDRWPVRFLTLDLDRPWPEIRGQLLSLVAALAVA